MKPVLSLICLSVLSVTSYGQQQWLPWYSNSTFPTGVNGSSNGTNEVCTKVPANERFLTRSNKTNYNYMVKAQSWCYKEGDVVEVTVLGYHFYTGFILQANSIWKWDNTSYGMFSKGMDSYGLEPMTCGDSNYDNVMMTAWPDYYTNHTFYWHAAYGVYNDIVFNATFFNEWAAGGGKYWTNVTSQVVEYIEYCNNDLVFSGGNHLQGGGFLAILACVILQLIY